MDLRVPKDAPLVETGSIASCSVLTSIGNPELLEADVTRAEVLPCGGRTQGKTAEQLHQRLLGSKYRLYSTDDIMLIRCRAAIELATKRGSRLK
jgi:hypothetical protein